MQEPSQQIIPPTTDPNQLNLFAEALEVERERIRSQDRRTDVVRAAIDANDAADKRQFEFHLAKLEEERSSRQDRSLQEHARIKLATGIAIVMGSTVVVVTLLIFWMLFFGTSTQSVMALSILQWLASGVGGFGIIYACIQAFRALVGKR